jgi:signal transduction histidine kinase
LVAATALLIAGRLFEVTLGPAVLSATGVIVGGACLALVPNEAFRIENVATITWFLLPIAIGDSVRSRRAVLAGLRERALRAELTREEEATRRVEEERLRIARELHDVVAHELTLINAQAGVGLHLLGDKPEIAGDVLATVRAKSREALDELRQIVGLLAPRGEAASREPLPHLDRLPQLVASFEQIGLGVDVVQEGSRPVPQGVSLVAYRVVQEALINAHKHAGMVRTSVRVVVGTDALRVEVENAAPSIPTADGGDGSRRGLLNLSERVSAVGGTFRAEPTSSGGFRVDARLPLAALPDPIHPSKGAGHAGPLDTVQEGGAHS